MTSQINIAVPPFGNPTTQTERINWTVAANEISTLQVKAEGAPFLPLAGGKLTGPMYLYNDPTDVMMPATKGYVDAHSGSGGGGIPEAPADGQYYGRTEGSWQPVLPMTGGTLTGLLTLSADPVGLLDAVTREYADAIRAAIMPDAPSDGPVYGRSNGAWVPALPLAGGNVTGSVGIGLTLPTDATIVQTMAPAVSAVPSSGQVGGFRLNAYGRPGSYFQAGPAGAIGFDGSGRLALQVAASGNPNAAITWGNPFWIDYLGNAGVPGALAIATTLPADASAGQVISAQFLDVAATGGGLLINAYNSSGTYKRLVTGSANLVAGDTSGGFAWYGVTSGAGGSTINWGAALMTLSQSGALGGIKSMAISGTGDFSSSSTAQAVITAGGEAVLGFNRAGVAAVKIGLNINNMFAIGGWSWAAGRLLLDSAGNLTLAGAVTALGGSFTAPVGIAPGATDQPFSITVSQANYCRIFTTVASVRTWTAGVNPGGQYEIADITGSAVRFTIGLDGTVTLNGGTGIVFPQSPYAMALAWDGVNGGVAAFVSGGLQGFLIKSLATGGYIAATQQMIDGTGGNCYIWWTAGGIAHWAIVGSDRKLKENVKPATVDALGIICKLPVYDCDASFLPGSPLQHWDCALIADEVGEVIPRAYVQANPDEEGDYDAIRDLPLIATMVRAMQQLTDRVAALEQRTTN